MAATSTVGNPPDRPPSARPGRGPRLARHGRGGGFTYAFALIAVAVLALSAQAAVTLASHIGRRADEQELLFRGQAYRDAIGSYYRAGRTVKRFPQRLEDLLRDPRFMHKRHIRRLYDDPISSEDWRLLRDEAGGIRGVAPASEREPIRQARFPPALESFAKAASYREWRFVYRPERDIEGETAPDRGGAERKP